jgi:hypothetical protein
MSDEKKNNTPENEAPEKKEHKKKKEYKKEHEIFPDGVKHQFPHLGNNRKIEGRHRHTKATDIKHQWKDVRAANEKDNDTCTAKMYVAGRDRTAELPNTPVYTPLVPDDDNWFEIPYTIPGISKNMLIMSFVVDIVPDDLTPPSPGHITSHITNLSVSSDTLPPINNVPDWLRGYTFYTSDFPGTVKDIGYTNLEYDEDGHLLRGDWDGFDPMYIIGPYFDPNASTEYHGYHGTGYSDLRMDEITLGEILDNEGNAVFTLTFEYDSFHFEVEYEDDENGERKGKIVFKPREDQKAWFVDPYKDKDEDKNK